jgi:hypothetical protein
MWAPISARRSPMLPQFSDLPCYVFGELNALIRCDASMAELLRVAIPAELPRHERVK